MIDKGLLFFTILSEVVYEFFQNVVKKIIDIIKHAFNLEKSLRTRARVR